MNAHTLRTGRWIAGSVAFAAAATVVFETAGQSSPRPPAVRSNAYRSVSLEDEGVRTALSFALADQQKKNRSAGAVILQRVISAEHQESNGDNYRLCLSLDRRGRSQTARAVVHRSAKRAWSVALWAWGACGK